MSCSASFTKYPDRAAHGRRVSCPTCGRKNVEVSGYDGSIYPHLAATGSVVVVPSYTDEGLFEVCRDGESLGAIDNSGGDFYATVDFSEDETEERAFARFVEAIDWVVERSAARA